ncbi:MAG: hypothetical protein FJ276_07135 [Planctomycetes bacterium]|nr:hypothetical protein [Planctomycetota bacterium]
MTMRENTHTSRISPDNHPDWRWQKASRWYNTGVGTDTDDPWVIRAVAVLWALQARPTVPQLPAELYPTAQAIQLYARDALEKQLLEARLLAQQDDKEIAARCGTTPDVIAAYAALFFDVRGPGRKQVWLAGQFFGGTVPSGCHGQLGDALKQRAFFVGSQAVEELIEVMFTLDGRTVAACTAPDLPEESLMTRFELAIALLPFSHEGIVWRSIVRDGYMRGLQPCIPVAVAWTVLERAKISGKLRRQIKQLAKHQSQGNRMA